MTTLPLSYWWRTAASVIGLASLLGSPDTAPGGTVAIENKTLTITYDEGSNSFLLAERASGLVFLKQGKLEARHRHGPGRVGQRSGVQIGQAHRAEAGRRWLCSLELYNDLPFVLLRGELRNPGPAPEEVTSLSPREL